MSGKSRLSLHRFCFINFPGLGEWIKFKHTSLKSCLTLRVSRGRPYYYVRGSILSSLLPASLRKNSKARTGDRTLRGNPLSAQIYVTTLAGRARFATVYMESIFFIPPWWNHIAHGQYVSLFLFLSFSHSCIFLIEVMKVSAYHATRQPPPNTLRFPVRFSHSYVFHRSSRGQLTPASRHYASTQARF